MRLGQRLAARSEIGPDAVTTVKTKIGTLAVGVSTGEPCAVSNVCGHQLAALGEVGGGRRFPPLVPGRANQGLARSLPHLGLDERRR